VHFIDGLQKARLSTPNILFTNFYLSGSRFYNAVDFSS